MSLLIELRRSGARMMANTVKLCWALLTFAVITGATERADASAPTKGPQGCKPCIVEHIGIARAGNEELQAAVKAGAHFKALTQLNGLADITYLPSNG